MIALCQSSEHFILPAGCILVLEVYENNTFVVLQIKHDWTGTDFLSFEICISKKWQVVGCKAVVWYIKNDK